MAATQAGARNSQNRFLATPEDDEFGNETETINHAGVNLNTFDIVIVNFNSTDVLLECLETVYQALGGIPATVHVLDNASQDGVDRLKKAWPNVVLTRNRSNLGFGKAVNMGMAQGGARYIVLLNPDTRITEGFFVGVRDFMEASADVGVMGPRILNADGSVQGSARSFPNLLTAFFGRKSLLSRLFPSNPITQRNILTNRSSDCIPMAVDWVSGACMVVRRTAMEKVGLFDERFFMYWEDADWCRRMWEGGWKVVYFPCVSIFHTVGASSEKWLLGSIWEFHKSSYRLFEKYNPHCIIGLKSLILLAVIFRFLFSVGSNLFRAKIKKKILPPQKTVSFQTSPKVRVLRVISRLNIGGPAIHVYRLMKDLDSNRFTSRLVTGSLSPREGDMAYLFQDVDFTPVIVPELQRELSPWKDLAAAYKLLKLMVREAPEIVHTHTAKAGTSARLAVLIYNRLFCGHTRTVHTFHGHIFEGYFSPIKSQFFIWIERFLARHTDAIVAISDTQKTDLTSKYAIASWKKIHVIPLGFNLKPFLSCRQRAGEFRRRLGIGQDCVLIGIVGRLVPIKNHQMLFDAVKRFVHRNPDRNVRLAVVGDGHLRREIQQIADRSPLNGRVHFCGWVNDIPPVYADLDVLALTSRNEGTPVSIIEAMAAGVPVIATDAGGVRDLMGPVVAKKDGFRVCQNGLLCLKDDARGFAAGLEFLAAEDPSQRAQRVQRARSFVTRQFDQARLIADIETLYEKLNYE